MGIQEESGAVVGVGWWSESVVEAVCGTRRSTGGGIARGHEGHNHQQDEWYMFAIVSVEQSRRMVTFRYPSWDSLDRFIRGEMVTPLVDMRDTIDVKIAQPSYL